MRARRLSTVSSMKCAGRQVTKPGHGTRPLHCRDACADPPLYTGGAHAAPQTIDARGPESCLALEALAAIDQLPVSGRMKDVR